MIYKMSRFYEKLYNGDSLFIRCIIIYAGLINKPVSHTSA